MPEHDCHFKVEKAADGHLLIAPCPGCGGTIVGASQAISEERDNLQALAKQVKYLQRLEDADGQNELAIKQEYAHLLEMSRERDD